MGSTTANYGIPYPTGTDRVADGDNAIQALAEKLDRILTTGGYTYTHSLPTFRASGTVVGVGAASDLWWAQIGRRVFGGFVVVTTAGPSGFWNVILPRAVEFNGKVGDRPIGNGAIAINAGGAYLATHMCVGNGAPTEANFFRNGESSKLNAAPTNGGVLLFTFDYEASAATVPSLAETEEINREATR